jgi:hypothetical protein
LQGFGFTAEKHFFDQTMTQRSHHHQAVVGNVIEILLEFSFVKKPPGYLLFFNKLKKVIFFQDFPVIGLRMIFRLGKDMERESGGLADMNTQLHSFNRSIGTGKKD